MAEKDAPRWGLRPLMIVQAGGQGSRMDVLTRERAKPALPFAGNHRLIDFPLSTAAGAGFSEVWVSDQYQSSSMDDYLAGGRPWDLDRNHGGFRRMSPQEGGGGSQIEGFAGGNAEDLFSLLDQIGVLDPDLLIVTSADSIYSFDLAGAMARHLASGAGCTVLTSHVGRSEAKQKMVVEVEKGREEGRVTSVAYKPSKASTGTVATEVFLYDPAVLKRTFARLVAKQAASAETELGDFGDQLLPELVRRKQVRAEPMTGYWKDVGRPQAYLQAHRDLLAGRVDVFSHPSRPILAPVTGGPAGLVSGNGSVENSMIGLGSVVRGRVVRSVLGPGVTVQAGALVQDSVLFGDTLVEAGAQVHTSIVDTGVTIGRKARVGQEPSGTRLSDDQICMIGKDSTIGRGAELSTGTRMEPGSTA
ncbi:glucose-1-phosphate adenylyltransferase family protein [Naumannella halotolerans]|nr:sugar phosphate nucleotidyltransferase [Naumannella halotolerans]